MKIALASFAALTLLASPAAAQIASGANGQSSGSVPQGSATGGTNANGERLICRRLEDTGTRMAAHRVCMTQREWTVYNHNVADR